jgi:Stage II sporulation protein E (SpoIIE)/Beta-galactosidase jelly roll domain
MRRAGLTLLILLCVVPSHAHGESPKPQAGNVQVAPATGPVPVKLGESSTQLTGPWKFHTGDDRAWAQAGFDDSKWDKMDLTTRPGAEGVGWTQRGYPGYSGHAWYRLQVDVEGATHKLALKMPDQADDAYQVYVNGQLVGEFGKFSGNHVTAYPALPEGFPLPKGVGNGPVTIAIHMWMDPSTRFSSPDAGGLHGPPTLGYASLVNNLVRLDYDDMTHYLGSALLEVLILLMSLLMAATLFWLDREEPAYLWLALVCTATLLFNAIVLSVNVAAWIGQTSAVVLSQVILRPMRIGLWVLFWGYWFRLPKIGRLHRVVWPLVAVLMAGTAMLRPPLYGQVIPTHYDSFLSPALLIVKLGLGVILFLVAYRGFTTQKTEGWMAGGAVLLGFVANFSSELHLIHVPIMFHVLGFYIQLGTVATVAALLIITVMLLRRFIQAQALKEQWKMEIEQAQQVQQVLIPHELPQVLGLTIESEYRPAREVGGDFFQILPLEVPGTVLIVVGDVTGKGMQAGMLVALIIGAIRGAVLHSSEPAQILHEVNEQLCERNAIATCLILRIDPDGTVIIANAGQLSPYLNGVEIEMEGAFPIGIIPDREFSIASFDLQKGDSLFLMSDGVVEATDPNGALFGFERISELLSRHATSGEIAKAAQEFGQEDDILVLQVQRNGDRVATLEVGEMLLQG